MFLSNSFSNFSYFEFNLCKNVYIGKFPSTKTLPLKPDSHIKTLIAPGRSILEDNLPIQQKCDELRIFIEYLRDSNFGFYDHLGYLCDNLKKSPLNSDEIVEHLRSLFIAEVCDEEHHNKLLIRSSIDDAFSLTLYARQNTAPQEAMDAFVLFKSKSESECLTTLGYKKKSPSIKISFYADDFNPEFRQWSIAKHEELLTVGLYGYIAGPGEHLEPSEKAEINKILVDNEKALAEGDFKPINLEKLAKNVSTRAVAEEVGINLENYEVERYLIGVHDKPGRDPRYWVKTYYGVDFGYQRPSSSVLIAIIIKCDTVPSELPEPLDGAECAKNQIIKFDDLVKNFKVGGLYPPAFASHVENLDMLVKSGLHLNQ